MFNPLKSVGDLKKMRDQAVRMQKELEAEEIEVNQDGVGVRMTGNQKITKLSVDGQEDERLVEVLNQALKKSQEVAAKKLAQMGGGLQGLLGK